MNLLHLWSLINIFHVPECLTCALMLLRRSLEHFYMSECEKLTACWAENSGVFMFSSCFLVYGCFFYWLVSLWVYNKIQIMVRKMFTEHSWDFTAPDRVYIYPDFTRHLDLVLQHWGCKLTVGATVQPPLITSCLVPEVWIEWLDHTVKREGAVVLSVWKSPGRRRSGGGQIRLRNNKNMPKTSHNQTHSVIRTETRPQPTRQKGCEIVCAPWKTLVTSDVMHTNFLRLNHFHQDNTNLLGQKHQLQTTKQTQNNCRCIQTNKKSQRTNKGAK